MKPITIDSPESKSADIVAENVERLKELFPSAVADGEIDFDVLRQLLGDEVGDADEKFGLSWHGHKEARVVALTPSLATLRPQASASQEWSSTQNLILEGDNLEILKLLKKGYTGKVDLIFIDPPYNTGSDFVYADSFSDSIQEYLEATGGVDSTGGLTSSAVEISGRVRTRWLSMMLPRLMAARDLLSDDGLLLITIDDHEVHHLRCLCDEVFGSEAFVEQIAWKNKYGSGALTKGFASVHEHILCYSKKPLESLDAPLSEEAMEAYKSRDDKFSERGGYITQPLATRSKDPRPNLVYPIHWEGREIWPDKQWIWSKERVEAALANDELVIRENNGKFSVRAKQYLRDDQGSVRRGKPLSLMLGPFNQEGTSEVADLIGRDAFSFPKPTSLVRHFLGFSVNGKDPRQSLVLDFFAGSGTTAHAVMAQNASDGGRRRFILCQIPEAVEGDHYRNLAQITRDRVSKAGHSIGEGDVGYRAFALDSSNINEWDSGDRVNADTLLASVEHIKPDRTEQDVLYEIILKLGLELTTPIETREIGGKTVYSAGAGTLIVCIPTEIARNDVEEIAQGITSWVREDDPAGDTRIVFRDSAFADDVAKSNMTAILEQNGFDRSNIRSI